MSEQQAKELAIALLKDREVMMQSVLRDTKTIEELSIALAAAEQRANSLEGLVARILRNYGFDEGVIEREIAAAIHEGE